MSDAAKLLDAIKGRNSQSGIITADRYFREVEGCFGDGFCPVKMVGAEDAAAWKKALDDASQKLTFSSPKTRILKETINTKRRDGSILQFDCVVTTSERDLDGDVMEAKGAHLEENAPLLWQHVHFQPLGVSLELLEQNTRRLRARCAIADTALGRDAATLVKMGALRISHGFAPIDYEAMDDGKGWHFFKFKIFEISLVSLPANPQAIITSVGSKSFQSALVGGWAKAAATTSRSEEERCACKNHTTVPLAIDLTAAPSAEATPTLAKEAEPAPVLAASEPDEQVHVAKSFAELETEYFAELAKADTDGLRKAHRQISLMLTHSEEQQEAKEWDELFSTL